MSRHRNVRNMDLDDVLDDGYDEEDYMEEPAMTEEEQAQMAEATEDVLEMLGNTRVSIKDIQDALWYYYFDVDQAVSYLAAKKVTASTPSTPAAKQPSNLQNTTPSTPTKPATTSTASTTSKGTVMHDPLRFFLSLPRKQILSKRHVQDWIWRDLSWSSSCTNNTVAMEPVMNYIQSACHGYQQQGKGRPGRPIGLPVSGLLGGAEPAKQGTSLRSLSEQAASAASRPRQSLAGLANTSKTGLGGPTSTSPGRSPSLADLAKGTSSTPASGRLGQISRLASSSSSSTSVSPPASSSLLSSATVTGSTARPSLTSLAKPPSTHNPPSMSGGVTRSTLPTTSPSLAQLASQSSAPVRRSLASLASSPLSGSQKQQPSSKPLTPSPATNTPLSNLASLRNSLPSSSSSASSLSSLNDTPTSTPRRSLANLAKPAAATSNPVPEPSTHLCPKEEHADTPPPQVATSSMATDHLSAEEPSFTLIAPPSNFAVSIFEPLQPISKYMLSNALEAATQASRVLDQTMFQLGEQSPFQFDQPSPDDIVTKAQSRRTNHSIAAK
ncbi:Hsp70 suppressor, GTPase facilitates ribosomal subunit dissociation [Actinomortierella wolfii]|nr:Hsp70 suppressor, GTPase facilitates ribosomal subunit dissociation [Actinomortierella wolfii]